MISRTYELREQYGKFQQIDAEQCPGFHHVSCCQACGSERPNVLIGVTATGCTLLVGSTCAGILTSVKLPKVDDTLRGSGETYQDGNKTVVYITEEWMRRLGEYVYLASGRTSYSRFTGETTVGTFENGYAGAAYRNEFLHSIFQQARQNWKLSEKQFNSADKAIR